MAESAIWERWTHWSAEREEVLRRWQDAVARLHAVVAAEERRTRARGRAVTDASGGLTARERRAARQHAETGAYPVSRAARVRLATWIYHVDAVCEAEARWASVSRADAAAVEAARADLAVATCELLEAFGGQAAEITGRTLRELAALAKADRGE